MDEKQKLSCELLVYLDTSGDLESMRKAAVDFVASLSGKNIENFPPFTICLLIDVMELIDQCPQLGMLVIREPVQFQSICTDLFYTCLQTVGRDSYAEMVDRCQLNVTVRLTSVPTTIVEPNRPHHSGMVFVKGLLTAVSKPFSYIAYSVWVCPSECENVEVVLHHLPDNAPKCRECKSILFEQSRLRRCGDRVTASVLVDGQLIPRQLMLSDDLTQNLSIGLEYMAFGIIVKNKIHAWQMTPVAPPPKFPVTMPMGIKDLYNNCYGEPWMFIYRLASSIGADVCPTYEFMQLKITLLLSLASMTMYPNAKRSLVHVLAVGTDHGYVPRIMADAATYTRRTVTIGASDATVPDALLASSGGVCVLPLPMHCYSPKFTHNLLSAIEKNEFTASDGQVPLRSAIWAHGTNHKKFQIDKANRSECPDGTRASLHDTCQRAALRAAGGGRGGRLACGLAARGRHRSTCRARSHSEGVG